MSVHDDAEAARRGVYDAALSGLEAQVSSLSGQLALSESRLTAVESELTQTRADLATVTKAYDEYRATHPDAKPTTTTLMGVTVNGPVRKEYTDLHPAVQVSRVFWEGMSQVWADEPQHKAFPDSRWAVSCTKVVNPTLLKSRLDSIPAADLEKILAFCHTHEPENPDKGLTPAQHRANQEAAAPIIRAKGLRPASCLMGWTLDPDSGRNWREWISPDAVDVLYWDRYNGGQKKNPPIYQTPEKMLAPILAASQELGKPWGLWETGTNQFGDDLERVKWAEDLRALIEREGGECAIWYDRVATSGSTWDATMRPKAVAEAWLL
jgi:hypothetical protein